MPVFTFAIVDILPLIPPAGFLTHAWIYDDNFWFVRNKSHAEFTHFASLPYRMLHNESQMLHGEILVVVLFFLMKKSVFFFCIRFSFHRCLCCISYNCKQTQTMETHPM